MEFDYEYADDIYEGFVYMSPDTSILFKNNQKIEKMDYTISLGENPRYLIDLYCNTGRCGNIRWFMDGQKICQRELNSSKSKKGKLYFFSDEEMTAHSGEMYNLFDDVCYYDEKKELLCVGNPDFSGVAIEFLSGVVAVLDHNKLVAVFVKAKLLQKVISVKNK